MTMRFGISLPNGGEAGSLVQLAVDAEQAGWDGFFLWDHLQLDPQHQAETLDPWVLLGAMAVRTERVRLGTMVTPIPRRRPQKVVKELVTLDRLSAGRAVLGVGLGVPQQTEYGVFGEPTDPKVHAAKLDEALPVIDALLRGQAVDHQGEHYRVSAQLTPSPIQRPRPPIWVAATLPARAGVRRAKRWDGIFPMTYEPGGLTPDRVAALVAELQPAPGFDVVVSLTADAPADELAEAGATWAIDGARDRWESRTDIRNRILAGPPR
ncbi:LLM class flavin-dependent oxidoreductase [Microlunatus speluncae]|uniref:LLM class flavin-dependent oxidoreductase n=1 Tax=Microlunatus speluncae TaxID=2594267 RepID=UPI001C2CD6FD|nr:LLM class flavin-dependent oxidoreductase [Microlunatus speluncae]